MTRSKFYKKAFKILLMAKLLKFEPEMAIIQITELGEQYDETQK